MNFDHIPWFNTFLICSTSMYYLLSTLLYLSCFDVYVWLSENHGWCKHGGMINFFPYHMVWGMMPRFRSATTRHQTCCQCLARSLFEQPCERGLGRRDTNIANFLTSAMTTVAASEILSFNASATTSPLSHTFSKEAMASCPLMTALCPEATRPSWAPGTHQTASGSSIAKFDIFCNMMAHLSADLYCRHGI